MVKFLPIITSALLAAPSLVSAFIGTKGETFINDDGGSFYFSGTNACKCL